MPSLSDTGFLFLCIRIPKSGSSSLQKLLEQAFADQYIFSLPNTLELDGRISPFQHLRFRRSQMRNTTKNFLTPSLSRAFSRVNRLAQPGNLLTGGHIDFRSVEHKMRHRVKIITILRNPYDRCRSEYLYARAAQLRKKYLEQFDSSIAPKIAAKYDFDGYLDFLLDHREIYRDIANSYLGISAADDVPEFFLKNVFHCGVLERSAEYARTLGEKLNRKIEFPHLNRTDSREKVSFTLSAKAKIETLYARDFQIYEWQYAGMPNLVRRRGEMPKASVARSRMDISTCRVRTAGRMIPAVPGLARSGLHFVERACRFTFELLRDERMPFSARIVMALGLLYPFTPFNTFVDSVRLLSFFDDEAIIVASAILAAYLVPRKLISEHLAELPS